jgi:hypothetical protein
MSPASYLTAPPRVAGESIAPFCASRGCAQEPCDYALLVSVWLIALIFSALVVIAALVHLVRRGLQLYRAARDSGTALGDGVTRVSESAEQTALKAERVSEDSERMAAAVERLSRSRAQLDVLLTAIREVRDSLGRVTALVPRK